MQNCIDKPNLMVVAGEGNVRAWPRPRIPSLSAQPFRPGELPTSVPVHLPAPVAQRADANAREHHLPTALWVRIAVEANRQLAQHENRGWSRSTAIHALDGAAGIATANLSVHATHQHERYANLLLTGESRGPGQRLDVLLLPDGLLTAWSLAGAATNLALSDWIADALDAAPVGCVRWEAAAARLGASLGEWITAVLAGNYSAASQTAV